MRSAARSISPLLKVGDLQRSLRFYRDVLGFREPETYGDPPCFAMMNRNGLDLMLSVAQAPEHVHPNGAHGDWDFYLRVKDIDAEIDAIRAAGGQIADGPRTTFYEMKEIDILDPDGHRICLGQDILDSPC
jgi:predicted enzyme related to lactoylglutathione lyase